MFRGHEPENGPVSPSVTTETKTTTPIALPDPTETYSQDKEWLVVRLDGQWEEVQFHDYGRLYDVPGLYERLFYDILQCQSPATVRRLLQESMESAGADPADLRVLDLGAGNGIMAEELRAMGAAGVVGIDIIPEAAEAAERDRPEVYDDYHVVDMTELDEATEEAMRQVRPTGLTCVAALGFADIPPEAFRRAYNLLEPDSWLAFNIKEDFLTNTDSSGFSGLIARAVADGDLEIVARERYQHRLATSGIPLHYIALIATKRRDLPSS